MACARAPLPRRDVAQHLLDLGAAAFPRGALAARAGHSSTHTHKGISASPLGGHLIVITRSSERGLASPNRRSHASRPGAPIHGSPPSTSCWMHVARAWPSSSTGARTLDTESIGHRSERCCGCRRENESSSSAPTPPGGPASNRRAADRGATQGPGRGRDPGGDPRRDRVAPNATRDLRGGGCRARARPNRRVGDAPARWKHRLPGSPHRRACGTS